MCGGGGARSTRNALQPRTDIGRLALHGLDFTSWQSLLATLASLALVALVGVGIRLVAMATIQQKRERANRQINERLRTLIAAYKTLGGSFTGNLAVDPRHLRDLQRSDAPIGADAAGVALDLSHTAVANSDRTRRIRDSVEAALSDILLLGTDEQVRLAAHAAAELVGGRPVHTDGLVASLRAFIRAALDLDPIPSDLALPRQGPARPRPERRASPMANGVPAGKAAAAEWAAAWVAASALAPAGMIHIMPRRYRHSARYFE